MRITQRYGRILQIGVTVAAGILLMGTAVKSQIPAVGPVWEYSMVIGSPAIGAYNQGEGPVSKATICYASAAGCRNEQVSVPAKELHDGNEAVMAAATRLGEKGWELTSTSEIATDHRADRILYFKRLRSVLNRSETTGGR